MNALFFSFFHIFIVIFDNINYTGCEHPVHNCNAAKKVWQNING